VHLISKRLIYINNSPSCQRRKSSLSSNNLLSVIRRVVQPIRHTAVIVLRGFSNIGQRYCLYPTRAAFRRVGYGLSRIRFRRPKSALTASAGLGCRPCPPGRRPLGAQLRISQSVNQSDRLTGKQRAVPRPRLRAQRRSATAARVETRDRVRPSWSVITYHAFTPHGAGRATSQTRTAHVHRHPAPTPVTSYQGRGTRSSEWRESQQSSIDSHQ
jgi:hypothetical protein